MMGIVVNKEELKKKNLLMLELYEDLMKLEYKGIFVMLYLVLFGIGFLIVFVWL